MSRLVDAQKHRADELLRAIRVLLTYVGNVVAFPSEPKYRKVTHFLTECLPMLRGDSSSAFVAESRLERH